MENFQPSQSFKYRGVSLFIQQAKEKHGGDLHVVAASNGNGALAAACASKALFLECTVFVTEGVSQGVVELLKREEAKVIVEGKLYSKALKKAKAAVAANPKAILVPTCDDQVLWNGYASMIQEIQAELDFVPDVMFCSVGGGGLLGGIIHGCDAGWSHVPIVAIEPLGSNCFYSSMALNMTWKEMYHIKEIKGMAKDVNIKEIGQAPKVVHSAMMRTGEVTCVCVPDEMMMSTAVSFADEHKVLAELACAAALTPAYETRLMSHLLEVVPAENGLRNTVFIVSGGFDVSLAKMDEFREILRRDLKAGNTSWECYCDGNLVTVKKKDQNRI